MLRMIVSRLMRHAFLSGYESALNNATLEVDGQKSWSYYEPETLDWDRLEKYFEEEDRKCLNATQ